MTRDDFKRSATAIATDVAHRTEGDLDITTYTTSRGTPALLVFSGKANKPAIHKGYWDVEGRDKAIANVITNTASRKAQTIQRRAERTAPHTLKVGDILYSSWGYEQTNVNFYQVVELKGKNSVVVREIHSRIVSDNGPTTHVVAVPDSFLTPRNDYDKRGLPITKRVDARYNSINISSYEWAKLWDGKPQYETGAGWGH